MLCCTKGLEVVGPLCEICKILGKKREREWREEDKNNPLL
jgi:hypothetical protein